VSKFARDMNALIAAVQNKNSASIDPIKQSALSIRNAAPHEYAPVPEQTIAHDAGLGSRIIDVLSRPVYAAANTGVELVKNIQGDPTANDNPLGAFWEGLSGQKKNTFYNVLDQASPDAPTALKAGAGLAGDLLLDPSNLIAGGAGAAVKAAKGISKGAKAVEETAAPVVRQVTGIRPLPEELKGTKGVDQPRYNNPELGDEATLDVSSLGGPTVSTAPSPADTTPTAPVVQAAPPLPKPKSAIAPLDDVSPESYDLAVNLVIKNQIGRPSDIQKALGVDYKTSMRVLKHMEKEGIVGKTFRKESKGGFNMTGGFSNTRPVLVNHVDEIPARKIMQSNQKIEDAALVANASAPDTVQALPVENVPRATVDTPQLQSIDMDKLGTESLRQALNTLPKKANGQGALFGRHRAIALRDAALPAWKSAVEARIAEGATPTIKATDGTEYVMSTPHALSVLPPDKVENMLYGAQWARTRSNTSLYNSQVNAGIAESLRLDDLNVPLPERYAQVADAMKAAKHGATTRAVPDSLIHESAKTFVDNTVQLRQAQFEAAKAFRKKDLQDAGSLSEAAKSRVIDSLSDKSAPTSQAIKNVANIGNDIAAQAKAIGASDNASSIAAQEAAKLVGEVAPKADTTAARAVQTIANARAKNLGADTSAAQARLANAAADDAEVIGRSVGVNTLNISNKVDVRANGIVQALMNPLRNRFSFGYGTGNFAESLRAGEAVADKFAHNYHVALGDFNKQFGKDGANTAFSAIKRNEAPVEGLDAHKAMQELVDHVFDTEDALLGAFWRTGEGIGEINRALSAKGLRQYKFIKEESAVNTANQWRQWDIEDPLDFLDKAHAGLAHLAAKRAAGIEFSRLGSATPKPGYVKITANEESMLGNFLDKRKYYPKETAEMFSRLEHTLNQPHSFRGEKGAIAAIINNVVDPFMQLWKPFVTIIRPGHHVRNIIGDAFMTAMDGQLSLLSYKRSMHMMAAGGRLEARGLEGLKELEGGLKAGGDVMSTVRLKGRNQKLSYDNGYQLAMKHGLLQSFRRSEDFDEATGQFVQKVMDSAPLRIAGIASEKSAMVSRLAHFEKLLRDVKFTRQFSNLDEAAAAAAVRVRKFHPDSRGLTPFESKYMRRLIPFYSWIRQAFPTVVSTAISKPGRVTALPKASYNAAIALGMDPNSISDQFPSDTLYPSFITDTITGPLGSYGYNLGSPQEGILGDTLNGNIPRNIASMLNPLIKTPIEFTTDQSLSTGAYIADKGEAVDQLIPGVNQIANISGYSPTGSIATLSQGLGLDPQRAMQRGEKEAFFNTNLANFLSGLGIQNYDKPSYRKIAIKEG